jgi:hypothetical protein
LKESIRRDSLTIPDEILLSEVLAADELVLFLDLMFELSL